MARDREHVSLCVCVCVCVSLLVSLLMKPSGFQHVVLYPDELM
jgi:hypothetical protein